MDLFLLFLLFAVAVAALILSTAAWGRVSELRRREEELDQSLQILKKRLNELEKRQPVVQHEVKIETGAPAAQKTVPAVSTIRPPVPRPVEQPLKPQPVEPVARKPEILPAQAAPAAPNRKMPSFDWENLVGVKLFSWVAGVALLLGAVFFLRYSIDRGWLMPPVRVAIGALVGVGLLVLCEFKAARKYPITANAMDGSAVAILFSTFFAAHALWHMIGVIPAFALMVSVTVVAVLLSIRRDSVFIALLGLAGGFATPALLSTGENRPISLFGYLLLLNAGLGWVAARKKWPLLTTLSLLFTTFYQFGWVAKFLTAGQLPLSVGIFLVFPVLAFAGVAARSGEERRDWRSLCGQTANVGAMVPLFYALYLAAVPGYGSHFVVLFVFLFLLDAGLCVVAAAMGQDLLHTVGALTTLVVFAVWMNTSYSGAAWPLVLPFVGLFVLFYLAAPLLARSLGRGFKGLNLRAVYAAPLLLFIFPALAEIEPGCAYPGLPFSVLFLLAAAVAFYAVGQAEGAVYLFAAVAALSAEAVWSARHLASDRLIQALVVYCAFALLFLAVPLLARKQNKQAEGDAGPAFCNGIYLGLAGHLFLLVVAGQKTLAVPPWPLLVALIILDLAAGAAALYVKKGGIHLGACVASAFVLMMWLSVATEEPWPVIAAISAGVLVVFSYGWRDLASRLRMPADLFAGTAAGTVFLAQMVLMLSAAQRGAPPVGMLIAEHLALLAALLWLARARGWHILSVAAALTSACAAFLWQELHSGAELRLAQLSFSGGLYLAFLVYPLFVGRRVGKARAPHSAAVLASALFFFLARETMLQAGWGDVIGILPVSQALLLSLLLVQLLRIEPSGERTLGRLALVAGAVLAFLTVAIPLQLEKEWITIGWALEGTALAWLFGRIPHKGLVLAAGGLFTAVFVRLTLNPSVLDYAPRSPYRIWNWYLYTYALSAAAMILAAWLLTKPRVHLAGHWQRIPGLLYGGSTILLFFLLNIEIADFYSEGTQIIFRFSATLAQDLTYTLGWALFALALLAVGIAARSRAARSAALGLLVATILKCFLHDLARLGGLYRVMSFVGLALCLSLVAMALQKFVLSVRHQPK